MGTVNGDFVDSIRSCAEKGGVKRGAYPLIIAHQEKILSALEAGWTKFTIWKFLHDGNEFPGSYNAFLVNLNRFLSSRQIKNQAQPQPQQAPENFSPGNKAKRPREFQFSNKINREELYGKKEEK